MVAVEVVVEGMELVIAFSAYYAFVREVRRVQQAEEVHDSSVQSYVED